MKRAKDKPEVVVITGASAGVGRAAVRAFAKRGAHIGLLARGRAGLDAAKREAEAAGGRVLAIPTDVSDAGAVERAAERVENEFGPIDIWVNDAMVSVFSPLKEMTPDEFKRVTEVTYLGYVYGTMTALKRMLPRDRGKIIQVGSALAYRSIPLQAAYCGAKHAIVGFTDSLRCELIHDGSNVEVTVVHMPALNTPQFGWVKSRLPDKAQPVPPIYQPEVAAEAIVWAADHDRREVWVGAPTYEAILGQKVVPGLLDHFLGRTGYASQQTGEPESPERANNLWEPQDDGKDHGARGAFSDRAKPNSWALEATERKGWLALGAGLLISGVVASALAGNRSHDYDGQQTITPPLLLTASELPAETRKDGFTMSLSERERARALHLSHELRTSTSPVLKRRRAVAGLSLLAAGSMGVIALYQLGIIKHLPEPPLPGLDADKVDASAEAYSRFRTPDAFLGLGSYAATAALAAMGGEDRARTTPLIPLALAAKMGFDTLQGVRLSVDQATKQGAFCSWCLLAAGATFAAAPRVLPEAREALEHLLGAKDGRRHD